MKKGERNNQSHGQKACFSARSFSVALQTPVAIGEATKIKQRVKKIQIIVLQYFKEQNITKNDWYQSLFG